MSKFFKPRLKNFEPQFPSSFHQQEQVHKFLFERPGLKKTVPGLAFFSKILSPCANSWGFNAERRPLSNACEARKQAGELPALGFLIVFSRFFNGFLTCFFVADLFMQFTYCFFNLSFQGFLDVLFFY